MHLEDLQFNFILELFIQEMKENNDTALDVIATEKTYSDKAINQMSNWGMIHISFSEGLHFN